MVKRGGREYRYYRVVHITTVDGKTEKSYCYLGPVGRPYDRVENVHGLGLTNLLDQDPTVLLRNAVQRLVKEAMREPDPEQRKELLEKVRRLKEELNKLSAQLDTLEKELKGEEGEAAGREG
ncbi:MAG: hypothetical protein RXP86_08425 [Acidilobus sp.]